MAINFKSLSQSGAEQDLNRVKERSTRDYQNDIDALKLKIEKMENELQQYKELAAKFPKVIKNNKVYIIENISQFCKDHDLNRTSLYALINGQQAEYKGWRKLT